MELATPYFLTPPTVKFPKYKVFPYNTQENCYNFYNFIKYDSTYEVHQIINMWSFVRVSGHKLNMCRKYRGRQTSILRATCGPQVLCFLTLN